jgi:repressor LexA
MHEPLTDRQQQVLDFIHAHHRQHGVSPSLREIQAHFGLASPFGIKRHVDALTEKGALRRLDGKARGLLPQSHPRRGALAEIPLYGTIPAAQHPTLRPARARRLDDRCGHSRS